MKKLILLLFLFPFVCLAQKKVSNQTLMSNCTEIAKYSAKEDVYKTIENELIVSAEIKDGFLFINNFDLQNTKEISFKIIKLLKKEGTEVTFTIDVDGKINKVVYNSADEGNRKTLLITDSEGNFTTFIE